MSKVVLQAVMSKDEAATIRAIAKAKGMPVSTWLRMIFRNGACAPGRRASLAEGRGL